MGRYYRLSKSITEEMAAEILREAREVKNVREAKFLEDCSKILVVTEKENYPEVMTSLSIFSAVSAAGARSLSQALQIRMSRKRKFLIPAALVLIGVSLWNILPDYLDKRASSRTYEELREDYTEVPAGDDTEKKKDWWLTDVLIRFDELKEQNSDIVAWIRSDDPESTGIDYPVLYSGDNEKYLRRDLYGEEHIAGASFWRG